MRRLLRWLARTVGYPVEIASQTSRESRTDVESTVRLSVATESHEKRRRLRRTLVERAALDRLPPEERAEAIRLAELDATNARAARSARAGHATHAPSVAWRAPAEDARRLSIVGGRLTVNDQRSIFRTAAYMLPPPDHYSEWRVEDLSGKGQRNRSPSELLDMLASISPEVSRALWDFLRMTNPGYRYDAFAVGQRNISDPRARRSLPQAKKALDAFWDTLRLKHGAPDVVIGRLFFGAFMRGGLFGELVFDLDARTPYDIATPDPASVRFRVVEDPVEKQRWQLGQWQAREFVPLEAETISYIPIDPPPGNPYGRPIGGSALFTTLFLIGLLHDLRRVIAQQGYPRLDIVVMIDKIAARMPAEDRSNPEAVAKWVELAVRDFRSIYQNLQPDDALVHDDGIEVRGAVGTVDSSSLGSLDGVISMLERQAIRALKTMPLMFGITDGVSEANANRQWEIHAAGVKAIQHLAESMLERFLELALFAQGIVADVEFRFSELRSAEELRDQQTLAVKIANNRDMRDQGWIDQDEASNAVIGHDAVDDEPESGTEDDEAEGGAEDVNPEPGSDRERRLIETRDAFRADMRANGHARITELVLDGRSPTTDDRTTAVVRTGIVRSIGGSVYREYDLYSRADPVVPAGSGVALDPVPTTVTVTATDADDASAQFDQSLPEQAGMLDATVSTNGASST